MRQFTRSAALGFLTLLLACSAQADVCTDWTVFKARFLTSDGRVVDRFQNSVSHSEGQGYGLVVAALCDDRETFASLWEWTRDNMQVRRTDSLLAWAWGERLPGQWAVLDFNNATDGDILVAWGLLLGAKQWSESAYETEATGLIASIREHLGVHHQGRLVLLPGYHGFLKSDSIRLNPSYYIPSAFQAFAEKDDADFWNTAQADSLALLEASLVPPLMLPPDWIVLAEDSEQPLPAGDEPVFGFETIRVPLYLSWAGATSALPELEGLVRSLDQAGHIPQRIDLTDGSFSQESGSAGFYAVFARAAQDLGMLETAERWWNEAARKFMDEKDDYYSNILYVLSRLEETNIPQADTP
ncbi:glycosyl hydrolase family 8 [Desulfonatronum sp. SC1]|uniref:glycosyl hydrolase family 8 n=1 Tax=Desulfonatronum sp. SC1 TaxID=2109626 RepID=UPI000D2FF247|nr:glycosyl hydrolase family 8 [Desulfonatronum sp. SC1]PTN35624.1 endoglucanase [Desulfonatronum sp. SC1]